MNADDFDAWAFDLPQADGSRLVGTWTIGRAEAEDARLDNEVSAFRDEMDRADAFWDDGLGD